MKQTQLPLVCFIPKEHSPALGTLYHRALHNIIFPDDNDRPDNIVESGSTQEVFLFQSQLLSLKHVVIGIQNSGDILGQIPVQHRLDVVSGVENLNNNSS